MIRQRSIALLAAGLAIACAKTTPAPGGLGDPCIGNNDCATGFACAAGKCVLPANLGGCEPGRLRCNGSDVEKCGSDGLAYEFVSACPTGCSGGACLPQACQPGARRCEGDAAEQCTPAGDSWALVQVCPSHCDTTTGQCKAPICTPFSVRCDPNSNSVQTCDSFGASYATASCASGTICDQGRCQGVVCAPGATRCSSTGGAIETCNALGDGWAATSACAFGCAASAGAASCLPPACAANQTRCDPSSPALEQCRPDQTGWAFVSFCATGQCLAPTGNTPAACAPPICAPGSKQCAADGKTPQVCSSTGTAWVSVAACPLACAGGECTTAGASCNPGDLRCNGTDKQLCTIAGDNLTTWTTSASCLAGCSSGACNPGGACAPATLVLHAALNNVPIDGQSSVLLYSDPIADDAGAPLPDGTVFDVSFTGAATLDGNASPAQVATVGGRLHFALRAPASGADFTSTVTATMARGASCSASTTVAFHNYLPAEQPAPIFVAEDFLTSTFRNVSQTNADWNTAEGALNGNWPTPVGAGQDGQLCVAPSGTTADPTAFGCTAWTLASSLNLSPVLAASYSVLGLTSQGVTLDRLPTALSGGDEVMLWDAQGSSAGFANAGSYELLHVAAVSGSTVSFVEAVRGTYGAVADQNVSTQRVVLTRVARLSQLVVLQGSTLAVDAWDGNRGGLLPLRVSGTAEIHGSIDVSGLGFRGGASGGSGVCGEDQTGATSQGVTSSGAGCNNGSGGYATAGSVGSTGAGSQTYGIPSLGRLFLGAAGGGQASIAGSRGGGALFLSAGRLVMNSIATPLAQTAGSLRADGASNCVAGAATGAGGSLWASALSLNVTGATFSARGGASGATCASLPAGVGRVRLDFQTSSVATPCSLATGSCSSIVAGPQQAQSLDAANSGSSLTIKQVTLVAAPGAPLAGDPSPAAFFAAASSADPPDFGALSAGSSGCTLPSGAIATVCFNSGSTPVQGPRFRWRTQLSPLPDAEQQQSILGLQWSLSVH